VPEELLRIFVNRPFGMVSSPPAERIELFSWITRSAINNKHIARGKDPTETKYFHKTSSDRFDADLSIEPTV
jgi:hypothetical protein